jgi:hypothetical protein
MDKPWLVIVLVVLIIIAACILCYSLCFKASNKTVIGVGEESLRECSKDIVTFVGGAEKIVSLRVLNKIMPYLKEVGDSKPVEEYLLKHFEYRSSAREDLYDKAPRDELAPKKYKLLHTIISDIINNNNIYTAEEFIRRARLTYREFLPDEYRTIYDEHVKRAQPVKEDVKKISKMFDKYLSEEGTYLIKSKLLDKTDDLIRTNSEYKFKPGRLDLSPTKLKSMAVSDPKKVFELDYVGMLPAMQEQAEASASKRAHEYGRRPAEEELRKQLDRDLETLRLLRDYPYTSARQRERDELARRLELAASRLYGPAYARKLLKDSYYEYPYGKYAYGVTDLYDYTKRLEAERETADERTRRIEAERQRDVARSQQIEADRAVAERMQREENERERQSEQSRYIEADRALAERMQIEENERANERQEARDREETLQRQLARAYEANPIAEREELERQHKLDDTEQREKEEVLKQALDERSITAPSEGESFGLEGIWQMGSKEKKEAILTKGRKHLLNAPDLVPQATPVIRAPDRKGAPKAPGAAPIWDQSAIDDALLAGPGADPDFDRAVRIAEAAHGRGEISESKRDELVEKINKARSIKGGVEQREILKEVFQELEYAKKDNIEVPLIPLSE